MLPDRIWILFGKKKNGEATPAELKELESLLQEYPDLGFTNELIEKIWDHPLGMVPETQISRNSWFSVARTLSGSPSGYRSAAVSQVSFSNVCCGVSEGSSRSSGY